VHTAKKNALTAFAIALLAIGTLVVGGGRSFGNLRPGLSPNVRHGERDGAGRLIAPAAGVAAGVARPKWLVAGPFRAASFSGLADPLDSDYLAMEGLCPAGEASAAPLSVGESDSKLWRETEGTADPSDGAFGVDFIAEFGETFDSVAYAYREVESASSGEAILGLGSDDGAKLWVNGNLVLANHIRRALRGGEDSIVVPLVKGWNRILVKVGQAGGEWGFSLGLSRVGTARGSSPTASLLSLGAYPDDLCVAPGEAICGAVMPNPSVGGFGSDWAAKVELVDASGAIRAETDARVGGRFSLSAPERLTGPVSLRARGLGGLAGLASPETVLFLGDPAASAKRAAALARSPSAAKTAAARFPELPDPAATLEFLACSVEGSLPSSLTDFDLALKAFSEIDALAGAEPHGSATSGAGQAFPRGLWRYAFRSPVDGSIQPYSLYLPAGYRRDGRYGLAVHLHGASLNDVAAARSLAAARPPDMLVLAPYCRGNQAYSGAGERDAIDSIDLIESRYAIDVDRVYLSGSSMGGFGTWRLAKLYPWKFAAAATFAGWTDLEMLENLIGMPLLVVHGDADPTIQIEPDKRAVEFLRLNGGSARFDVLPGGGHNALETWTAKEDAGRLFAWFRQYKRERWPGSIKVRTTMARAGRGAWASILGIERPLRPAAIDARMVDGRHIAVETENVSAFELDLRHPRLAKGGRILILADGVNLTADSGTPQARFELGPDGCFAAAAPLPGEEPPNGGSGLNALFDSPLRIVYGTKRRGLAAQGIEVARAIAEGMKRAGIDSVDISTDAEAEKAGLESEGNILLIGNPDENSALAALVHKLPIAWEKGRFRAPGGKASGTGLVLVCPDPTKRSRLVGVLAPPFRGRRQEDFARGLFAPMGYQRDQSTCGYGTADAAILDASGGGAWVGCFDWRWDHLKEIAPEAK
jgi:poly(3-hydroxybutyrate) depolymerase